jgi:hypothetical protein
VGQQRQRPKMMSWSLTCSQRQGMLINNFFRTSYRYVVLLCSHVVHSCPPKCCEVQRRIVGAMSETRSAKAAVSGVSSSGTSTASAPSTSAMAAAAEPSPHNGAHRSLKGPARGIIRGHAVNARVVAHAHVRVRPVDSGLAHASCSAAQNSLVCVTIVNCPPACDVVIRIALATREATYVQ